MTIRVILYAVMVVTLCACATNRGDQASAAYLSPAGWQNVEATLTHKTFAQYQAAIDAELQQFRIPFEQSNAVAERGMAGPIEIPIAAQCKQTPKGIAILVHGLSDTAFSMRDMATVMSSACFISRTVLLPGHGTRSGDLLTTRLSDWQNTVSYLVEQASRESDTVVLVGFSLGAVLTAHEAVVNSGTVDGLIAISPAYYLASYWIARWSPYLRLIRKWVDKGLPDDSMRYESIPMRAVIETVKAIRQMIDNVERNKGISIPWLVAQSVDEQVTDTIQNEAFFQKHANHPASRLVQFYSEAKPEEQERTTWISGADENFRVDALTHLAIHQSPENEHYGINGAYRNCGETAPRNKEWVERCVNSEKVWYGLWSAIPPNERAQAMSTFNPAFDQLSEHILNFLNNVGTQKVDLAG